MGLGLGFFATPALSAAVSNAPESKVGMASGIIKMTSTLGAAFGIAVVTTVYSTLEINHTHMAATITLLSGACMVISAFIVAFLVIPKQHRQSLTFHSLGRQYLLTKLGRGPNKEISKKFTKQKSKLGRGPNKGNF